MNKLDFSNIGYDYGIKPFLILVGDLEFADHFRKAECIGVVYGFRINSKNDKIPVQLGFMFQNEEPAKKFLSTILTWIEKSNHDGDAVSIDFIERNNEGYVLAISPEMTRFMERVIPKIFKDKVSPIAMVQTQFKEIESLGENYLTFKRNIKEAESIAIGYVIVEKEKIVKQSDKYFTKKQFNFYKEDEIPDNSLSISYNAIKENSKFDPKKLSKPPKELPEEIANRRASEIKIFFPLTIHKIENLWLNEVINKLTFEKGIIKQAICNLILFERLKLVDNLSENFTKSGYSNRILEYLLTNYESFDSYYPSDDFFTLEKIKKQILNDKKELESFLNK